MNRDTTPSPPAGEDWGEGEARHLPAQRPVPAIALTANPSSVSAAPSHLLPPGEKGGTPFCQLAREPQQSPSPPAGEGCGEGEARRSLSHHPAPAVALTATPSSVSAAPSHLLPQGEKGGAPFCQLAREPQQTPSPPAGEGWGEGEAQHLPSQRPAPAIALTANPSSVSAAPSHLLPQGEKAGALFCQLAREPQQTPSPPAGEGWGEGEARRSPSQRQTPAIALTGNPSSVSAAPSHLLPQGEKGGAPFCQLAREPQQTPSPPAGEGWGEGEARHPPSQRPAPAIALTAHPHP